MYENTFFWTLLFKNRGINETLKRIHILYGEPKPTPCGAYKTIEFDPNSIENGVVPYHPGLSSPENTDTAPKTIPPGNIPSESTEGNLEYCLGDKTVNNLQQGPTTIGPHSDDFSGNLQGIPNIPNENNKGTQLDNHNRIYVGSSTFSDEPLTPEALTALREKYFKRS